MAIAFRSGSTAELTTSYPATIDKPSGVVNDDIMLWSVAVLDDGGAAAITNPSGWTLVGTWNPAGYLMGRLYWKRAASEGANYSVTCSGSGTVYGLNVIGAFSGCLTSGSPIDVYSNTAYDTSNTTVRCGSVTTTVTDAMLVAIGQMLNGSANPFSPPSGMTEGVDANLNALAYVLQASAGASGTKDFVASVSDGNKHGWLVALKPAAAAGLSIPLLNHLLLGD